MLRFLFAFAVVHLGGSVIHMAAADVGERTIEQDRERLQGKWMLRGSGHEWILNLDPGGSVQIAISWKERGGTWAATGWKWDAGEDEHVRYIELDEPSAKASELPQHIPYHFDRDRLVIDVAEGPLKGQHVFTKSVPGVVTSGHGFEVALIALLLLVTTAILFRNRNRRLQSSA